MPFIYRCTEYPGMEGCPGSFVAATRGETLHHVRLHAREAHQEDPDEWPEDRRLVDELIREHGT